MAGRKHEVEPEVDSLSFIDFEDDDQGYLTAMDLGGRDLENWWVESGLAFLSSASVIPDGADENVVRDQLHEEYQCSGEELFWGWVIDQALEAGFDVYDSDTRTELFPGGTRCNEVCPADCVGEDDLHQEHISGGHGDTRRGDCPLCREAFGPTVEEDGKVWNAVVIDREAPDPRCNGRNCQGHTTCFDLDDDAERQRLRGALAEWDSAHRPL